MNPQPPKGKPKLKMPDCDIKPTRHLVTCGVCFKRRRMTFRQQSATVLVHTARGRITRVGVCPVCEAKIEKLFGGMDE